MIATYELDSTTFLSRKKARSGQAVAEFIAMAIEAPCNDELFDSGTWVESTKRQALRLVPDELKDLPVEFSHDICEDDGGVYGYYTAVTVIAA